MRNLSSDQIQLVKKLLLQIYVLNITDIVFTLLLLRTGLFVEANVFMQPIVANEWLGLGVKVIIPFIVMVYVIKSFETQPTTLRVFKVTKGSLYGILGLYAGVNVLHILYLILTYIVIYYLV